MITIIEKIEHAYQRVLWIAESQTEGKITVFLCDNEYGVALYADPIDKSLLPMLRKCTISWLWADNKMPRWTWEKYYARDEVESAINYFTVNGYRNLLQIQEESRARVVALTNAISEYRK